jgi:hypothetical protein
MPELGRPHYGCGRTALEGFSADVAVAKRQAMEEALSSDRVGRSITEAREREDVLHIRLPLFSTTGCTDSGSPSCREKPVVRITPRRRRISRDVRVDSCSVEDGSSMYL